MKMKDFWGVYDCFFSTINRAEVFVQRISQYPYHFNHNLYDWEIVDAVCHRDEWYWADYIIENIRVENDILYIMCREWE